MNSVCPGESQGIMLIMGRKKMKLKEILRLDARKKESKEVLESLVKKYYGKEGNSITIDSLEKSILCILKQYNVHVCFFFYPDFAESKEYYTAGILVNNKYDKICTINALTMHELYQKMFIFLAACEKAGKLKVRR